MSDITTKSNPNVDAMFRAGLSYGAHKSRRHPSTKDYVYGIKNNFEIVDLDKTQALLDAAKDFVQGVVASGKQVLFVANKNEARKIVEDMAKELKMPYMVNRWIGGTLTNFDQINKRTKRLVEIREQKESGELAKKYVKKELSKINKEEQDLNRYFEGIVDMESLPGALFVIDSGKESIAVDEANKAGVPTVALSNSDCDISKVGYPILGNDSASESIKYIVDEIANAVREGEKVQVKIKETETSVKAANLSDSAKDSPVAPKGLGGKKITGDNLSAGKTGEENKND